MASPLQVAYTWSKTMTETGYLNNFDSELERVIGPFDRTHVFVASGIFELPFGRGRHWGKTWNGVAEAFLGGWQVSSLFKAQSGAPLGFGNFLFVHRSDHRRRRVVEWAPTRTSGSTSTRSTGSTPSSW